jgi:hypothetical protein
MEGPAPARGETRRAECGERRVGVELARIARDFAEAPQVLGPARADDDERGAPPLQGGQGRGQANDLLAAEDSAEVSDKSEDGWPRSPEAAERHGAAFAVEHREACQARRQRVGHAPHLTRFRTSSPRGYNGPS